MQQAAEAPGQVFLNNSDANLSAHCLIFIFRINILTGEVPVYSSSTLEEDSFTLPKPRHTLFCEIVLSFLYSSFVLCGITRAGSD